MKKLILLLVLSAATAYGQINDVIPLARRVDWTIGTNAGVRGGIPTNRTQSGSTIAAGATAATIQTALNAAASGTYVLLGSGDFTIGTTLAIPNNVTLRGSGADSTRLLSSGTTVLAMNGGAADWSGGDTAITAGYTKGSTSITVASDPGLEVGEVVMITQDNEDWVWSIDTPYPTHAISGLYRIEAGSSGTSLNIWPALQWAGTGKNPIIRQRAYSNAPLRTSAGVEELKIKIQSDVQAVSVFGTYGCWVKNCKVETIGQYGILIGESLAFEAVHVDFANKLAGLTSEGMGIDFDNTYGGNTACAVYNCIFDGLWHGVLSSGSQGLVVAFNFATNEHDSQVNRINYGFNASHAAEGIMGLWEGNYSRGIFSDAIHGGAAYQTVFRNRFHGMCPNWTPTYHGAVVNLEQGSYYWNVVGNVLGNAWTDINQSNIAYQPTYSQWAAFPNECGAIFLLGWPSAMPGQVGNNLDPQVASTFLRYENYDYVNGSTQDTGAYTVPNSLAFADKPSWFGALAWPAYDEASPLSFGDAAAARTPAGYRYLYGEDPPAESETNPVINVQPVGGTYYRGSTAVLSVTATSGTSMTYQWEKNGTAISGATSATLTLSNVTASDAGSYTCVATNGTGSVETDAAVVEVKTNNLVKQKSVSFNSF